MKTNKNTSVHLTDQEIKDAFTNDLFQVYYQPMVPLEEHGNILGVEALARLKHPQNGDLVADIFIDQVRKNNLMLDLTKLLINKVAIDWQDWCSMGHEITISLNLDYALLAYPNLSKELAKAIEKTCLPTKRIIFEISQVTNKSFSEQEREQITRLRLKGFRLCLDNVGYSPVNSEQIVDLPIDQIKIDHRLVENVEHNTAAQEKVKEAIHMAGRLGAYVIAVGVASKKIYDWLLRQGCSGGQGYLFGPPLASEGFKLVYLGNRQRWSVDCDVARLKLMIVDDDPQYQTLFFDALSEIYDVILANTFAEAVALFETHKPDLLVLDVMLPDGSGIDLCQELMQQVGEEAFSAIFISGYEDESMRVEAYSAGGIDFLSKPFSMVDLIAKLGRVSTFQEKRKKLAKETDELRNVALGSMREAAHYGDVLQFLKKLFHTYDEQALAAELFSFMKKKGLNCSIQFRSNSLVENFSQEGIPCSPMEINIFELLHNRGRIQDFNNRTLFNDRHVSVLIKNMPGDGKERGVIRDYMAALTEGLEARFTDILRRRLLDTVTEELNNLVLELADSLEVDKHRNQEILEAASMELQMSFHVLNLSEDQEAHIMNIVDTMHKRSEEQGNIGEMAAERVKKLLAIIEKIENPAQIELESEPDQQAQGDSYELF